MSIEKQLFTPHFRRARVTIDLAALKHNALTAKKNAPNSSLMVVLKANAYGHGFIECAQTLLSVADELAVASMDDALFLRNYLAKQLDQQQIAITTLSGFYSADEIPEAVDNNVSFIVYDYSQLTLLEKSDNKKTLRIWIKVDTGMSRLGFAIDDLADVLLRIAQLNSVEIRGIVSHLANADEPTHTSNARQLARFLELKQQYSDRNWQWSLANSAAVMGISGAHQDWIRPGIMLYGSSPIIDQSAESLNLKPVMTFSTELISIRQVTKGESVGYGSIWTADKQTSVGVIACGYADGYPRHIAENTPVLIDNQPSKILGRVSMDLIVVDLTNVKATIGSEVVLWGKGLPIDEIARSAETIAYELLCGITQRVRKEYINVQFDD